MTKKIRVKQPRIGGVRQRASGGDPQIRGARKVAGPVPVPEADPPQVVDESTAWHECEDNPDRLRLGDRVVDRVQTEHSGVLRSVYRTGPKAAWIAVIDWDGPPPAWAYSPKLNWFRRPDPEAQDQDAGKGVFHAKSDPVTAAPADPGPAGLPDGWTESKDNPHKLKLGDEVAAGLSPEEDPGVLREVFEFSGAWQARVDWEKGRGPHPYPYDRMVPLRRLYPWTPGQKTETAPADTPTSTPAAQSLTPAEPTKVLDLTGPVSETAVEKEPEKEFEKKPETTARTASWGAAFKVGDRVRSRWTPTMRGVIRKIEGDDVEVEWDPLTDGTLSTQPQRRMTDSLVFDADEDSDLMDAGKTPGMAQSWPASPSYAQTPKKLEYMPLTLRWGPLTLLRARVYGGPYRECPLKIEGHPAAGVKMAEEIKGVCAIDLPTKDFTAPDPDRVRTALFQAAAIMLFSDRVLYVGCMGGTGRTGTFMAALAKLFGEARPITHVRKTYRKHAVEKLEQAVMIDGLEVRDIRRVILPLALARWVLRGFRA